MARMQFVLLPFLTVFGESYSDDITSLLEPIDQSFDERPLSDAESLRRRMQFSTTTSGPPTEPPSMPPTPLGSSLDKDDTMPWVYVDFGQHISWASANTFCQEQLGTHLASVDRLNEERINETAQIDLMTAMC